LQIRFLWTKLRPFDGVVSRFLDETKLSQRGRRRVLSSFGIRERNLATTSVTNLYRVLIGYSARYATLRPANLRLASEGDL
jgi:hypothetical protein